MSNKEIAVKVVDVTKSFKIPLEASSGIKQKVVNSLKGRKGYRDFTPLNGVSFEIEKGDFFGIVGRNGSGKSTLLKTIAGIYTPNKGSILVNGSLVPFIELGVGFNPELTGRENVFLNGALLGFSHTEMEEMYGTIVKFAELDDFMDERLKNYSSGMQVRLAFSIAIRAKADVLLLDEVLAVGDAAFQQKCYKYFEKIKKEKKTVIIVTHDMGAVKRFCNKALFLKNGSIEKIGRPQDIADIYTENNIERIDPTSNASFDVGLKLAIDKKRYKRFDDLNVEVEYSPIKNKKTFVNLSIIRNGAVIADLNTKENNSLNIYTENIKLRLKQPLQNLNPGSYDIYISLHSYDDDVLLQQIPYAASFLIEGYDPERGGSLRLDGEWSILK